MIPTHTLLTSLVDQYQNIGEEGTVKGNTYKSVKTYQVGDDQSAVAEVVVKMEFIKIELNIPEGAVFCGGRAFKNNVEVTVTPSDQKIIDVVSAHLKSQIVPGLFSMPAMPLYDSIMINEKKI